MAAFAYVLLPVTGMLAFFRGSTARTRFHGLQAVTFGLAWALALYGGSALSPVATKIVFATGCAAWLVLVIATAIGRDPKIPGLAGRFERWSG